MAETGHARNCQRFEEMVAFVTSWGGAYNPSNAELELAKLVNKLANANSVIDGVMSALADRKTAGNDRENTFTGLRKLTTRVVNMYAAASADANAIDDVRGLKRKIDGKRAVQVEDDPNTPEDESANINSVSQQSYTQLIEHFDNLIEILKNDPLYSPNEVELKIPTLENLSVAMKAANTDVINKTVDLSNARGLRDEELYGEVLGLVDKALLVKKYVKAAFGTDSLQYSQISGLEFTRPTE